MYITFTPGLEGLDYVDSKLQIIEVRLYTVSIIYIIHYTVYTV